MEFNINNLCISKTLLIYSSLLFVGLFDKTRKRVSAFWSYATLNRVHLQSNKELHTRNKEQQQLQPELTSGIFWHQITTGPFNNGSWYQFYHFHDELAMYSKNLKHIISICTSAFCMKMSCSPTWCDSRWNVLTASTHSKSLKQAFLSNSKTLFQEVKVLPWWKHWFDNFKNMNRKRKIKYFVLVEYPSGMCEM